MDNREVVFLSLAGGVLPVTTVLGVSSVTASYDLPWIIPFFVLLASPLFAAGGLYMAGVRVGSLQRPSWLPVGSRRTFGNEIPDRYHEEFSPETLEESTRDGAQSDGRLLALGIVYLVSIPVYTVVLWVLFS